LELHEPDLFALFQIIDSPRNISFSDCIMKAHRTPKQGVAKKAASRLDKEIESARRLENGLDSIYETVVSTERRSKRTVRKEVASSVDLV
jgi:hypothetical protein